MLNLLDIILTLIWLAILWFVVIPMAISML